MGKEGEQGGGSGGSGVGGKRQLGRVLCGSGQGQGRRQGCDSGTSGGSGSRQLLAGNMAAAAAPVVAHALDDAKARCITTRCWKLIRGAQRPRSACNLERSMLPSHAWPRIPMVALVHSGMAGVRSQSIQSAVHQCGQGRSHVPPLCMQP